MELVKVKAYLSPTLVLLALDWPDGQSRRDFLGFAIQREPGFLGRPKSWLPNRLGFDGPAPKGEDLPSDRNPIQKFMWWDARIDDKDRGKTITYTAMPVVGSRNSFRGLDQCRGSATVTIPLPEADDIGTYFNRAVVSSQAFSRKFRGRLEGRRLDQALAWLANGLEKVIPGYLDDAEAIDGAIYHLTDETWIIPKLETFKRPASFVYNETRKDNQNEEAVERLQDRVAFTKRTRASIMHNKFLVNLRNGKPVSLLMGSANFTTAGLSTQANLMHTFKSPELASLYLQRKRLLEDDPPIKQTAEHAGWSREIQVGNAKVRVFFPPEPTDQRESIDTVIAAVREAKSSVIFCLFMPTDAALRQAIFDSGDAGKMMFGLVNKISDRGPGDEPLDAAATARVEIYHRSRRKRDVFAHNLYPKKGHPAGFWWEVASLPGKPAKWPVYIHHKFVVIDAETPHPIIYTGSANMSKNAVHRNDENLLEIKDSPRLAAIYLAEFMRLYEHYRARAMWNRPAKRRLQTYKLQEDARWARRAYEESTPEYKSRINMVADTL
ncbi:MAG: phospholipase [Deltaproteobacteria bacterium]|nr:phospholipase [Deltaproteobacteria bacterium]